MKTYKGNIEKLSENQIFVFGSNTEGRHGMGSALLAKIRFGAIYGQAKGIQGKSYAIITKDLTKKIHPSIDKEIIRNQIALLYGYAHNNPDKEFLVAYKANTTNLNGYISKEMSDLFKSFNYIPNNIVFEEEFYKL